MLVNRRGLSSLLQEVCSIFCVCVYGSSTQRTQIKRMSIPHTQTKHNQITTTVLVINFSKKILKIQIQKITRKMDGLFNEDLDRQSDFPMSQRKPSKKTADMERLENLLDETDAEVSLQKELRSADSLEHGVSKNHAPLRWR